MGEVINLRQARKARAKAEALARADANRVKFGRSKTEKETARKTSALEEARLEAHRRLEERRRNDAEPGDEPGEPER